MYNVYWEVGDMNIAAFGCLAVMLGVLCGINVPTVYVLKGFLIFLQIFSKYHLILT